MTNLEQKTTSRSGLGRQIASGVIFSGGSNIILRGLEIFTSLLLLRWLSLFEYGAYQLTLSAFELFAGFFLSGLQAVVLADVARDEGPDPTAARTLFTSYALGQIGLGVLLWLGFSFAADSIATWVSGDPQLIRMAAFLFLISPLENLLKLALQIRLQFFWLGIYKILFVVGRIGILAILFGIGSVSANSAVISLIAASAFAFLLMAPFSRPYALVTYVSLPRIVSTHADLFRAHGKWAVAADFLGNIGSSIRPFIIRTFVGVEAVAIFSVAHNFAGYLGSAFPIRDVLSPIFPRQAHDPHALTGSLNRILKYSTLAFLLLAIVGAITVPALVMLLFPKYEASLPYFFLYLIGMPFWSFRLAVTPLFSAFKEQRMLFFLGVYRTLLTAVLGVILVWMFGVWGAAFEASLGLTLFIVPTYIRAIKKLLPAWKPKIRELFWFDASDRIVAAEILRRFGRVFRSGSLR